MESTMTARRRARIFAGAAALACAGAITFLLRPAPDSVPLVDIPLAKSGGPAMCPWREPEKDLRRFFSQATSYRTDTLALSSIRGQILKRLGPGSRIEDNSLYVHRALNGTKTVGSVLVRRTAGPHGAIEVVTAVDVSGRLVGVRVQRHREPEKTARALERLSAVDLLDGSDVTDRSDGGEAVRAVSRLVRAKLVELDEAEKYYGGRIATHHEGKP
jgi:hypothetical protein